MDFRLEQFISVPEQGTNSLYSAEKFPARVDLVAANCVQDTSPYPRLELHSDGWGHYVSAGGVLPGEGSGLGTTLWFSLGQYPK